jgi:DNA-binding MarR family transcriptional regulator
VAEKAWSAQVMEIDDSLRRAAASQRIAMERLLAPAEVTPAQFAVLQIVVAASGMSSAEVARLERLTPATVSVIVSNLERRGAIARRPHPNNARIQCLEPTRRGFDLREGALASIQSLRGRIGAAMPIGAAPGILLWLARVAGIEV